MPLQIARTGRHQPFQLTTELTDMEDGTYELKYGLPVEGQYELSIRLFGHHISGSPFKVSIILFRVWDKRKKLYYVVAYESKQNISQKD